MNSAVGIDIGNHKCVIAISRNFVVDAVLNDESSRETPTVVHFAKDHRIFGGSGASNAAAKPESTISLLKRLVGRRSDEPGIADELRLLLFQTSWDDRGNIIVEVTYRDCKHRFTAVEMLVMLLSHLKLVTVGDSSSNCIIGVPVYFTAGQKTAYLNSARAAGWNPLGMLSDGAAVAILYGAQRMDRVSQACVVFVDVGHCDTQITVAHLEGQAQESRILAVASDHKLGGRDFDEIIFRYFAARFRKQHGVDFAQNKKAVARLRVACEKAKKVLSTNRDARINLECFVGEKDVEDEITREEFEKLSSELVDRIGKLFVQALRDAKRGLNLVKSVELIGSGSRIPAISEKLSGIFRRPLSRTLNGSECIASGCALLCEMLQTNERLPNSNRNKVVIKMPMAVSWLTNNEFTSGVTASEDISSILKKEKQLAKWDQDHHSRSAQRNSLESYIYRKRNELSRKSESSTKERAEISQVLQEAEDWLYEEDNRDGDSYKTKLSEIRISIRSVKGAASLENPDDPLTQHNPCRLVGEGKRNQETAVENASAGSNSELIPKSYIEGMGTRVDPPTTRKEKKHKAENKTETAESAPTSQFKGVAADENQKMMRQPTTKSHHRSLSVHNPIEHHTSNDSNSPRATVDRNKKFNSARFNDLRLSPGAGADSISTSNQLQSRRKRSVGRIFKTILETIGIRRKGESISEGFIPGISTTYTGTNDPKV